MHFSEDIRERRFSFSRVWPELADLRHSEMQLEPTLTETACQHLSGFLQFQELG